MIFLLFLLLLLLLGGNTLQTFRTDLIRSIFRFWAQWISILMLTLAWLLITFLPSFENCPAGYLGPGGKHKHGKFVNCTGGNCDLSELSFYYIHPCLNVARNGWLR